MFKMMFQIDGGKEYPGFSNGDRWNGWECPYFTFEVAKQIADEMNAVTSQKKIVYDPQADCFVFEVSYYPHEEWEKFEAVMMDGMKLYPLGAWSWVWDGRKAPN